MNGAIPIADHMAIRSVQIRFALGNIYFKKDTVIRGIIQIINKEQWETTSEKELMFFG